MRQGPRHSPRKSDPRPTPPSGIDSRSGIRALDCGDEMNASETTIVRRAAPVTPNVSETSSGDGEQQQSV